MTDSVFDQLNEILDINEKLLMDVKGIYDDNKGEMSLSQINMVVNMLSKLTSNISTIKLKMEDIQLRDNIDFHHPKIQRGFMFFTEVFLQSMKEAGISDADIETVFSIMSAKLYNFEERLNKVLTKANMKTLEYTINPLVKEAIYYDKKDD